MGVPCLLVRRGANINKAEVDDVPAAIIECDDPVNDIKEWNATPSTRTRTITRPASSRTWRSLPVCRKPTSGQAARGHQRGQGAPATL